jgi:hypothetical protein
LFTVLNVLDDPIRHDSVERSIIEWQPACVSEPEFHAWSCAVIPAQRLVDHRLARVEADDAACRPYELRKSANVVSVPAANIEYHVSGVYVERCMNLALVVGGGSNRVEIADARRRIV